jgi:hypothetical protein
MVGFGQRMSQKFFRRATVRWVILVNLWPLFGVLFLGWSVGIQLMLYLVESAVMGIFLMAKVQTHENGNIVGTILFGALYLILVGGATAFIMPFFYHPPSGLHLSDADSLLWGLEMFVDDLGWVWLACSLMLMFYSHGRSFITHHLEGPGRTGDHDWMVVRSFGRVIAVLAVIFGGLILSHWMHSEAGLVVVIVGLKLGSDLLTHWMEHRRQWEIMGDAALPPPPVLLREPAREIAEDPGALSSHPLRHRVPEPGGGSSGPGRELENVQA